MGRMNLSLHVTELLGHLAVANLEQVDSAHVAAAPIEPPAHHCAIGCDDHLLRLESSLRRALEELVPEAPHVALADMPLAIGRRDAVAEEALILHPTHAP